MPPDERDRETNGDNPNNNVVIVHEIMFSPMKLELTGLKRWTFIMLAIFTLAEFVIFFALINDTFLFAWTLFCGILLILVMTAYPLFVTLGRSHLFETRLEYTLFADRIVVSMEKSGDVVFDFPTNEISLKESKYNNSRYCLKYNNSRYRSDGQVGTPFIFCDLPCLLISSDKDEKKQRVPVGYTQEARAKLREYLSTQTETRRRTPVA